MRWSTVASFLASANFALRMPARNDSRAAQLFKADPFTGRVRMTLAGIVKLSASRPKRIVTDGLRSYAVARREILPQARHRTSRYLNNRAENSHQPTRRRERQMQRFKSPQQAQRFLAAHAIIYGHFRQRRHLMTADQHCRLRSGAFQIWQQETHARTTA
jgi:hypothetical protein